MLHAYDVIPFDNKDGGVWKQGWEIKYDKEAIKQEKKLEVIVIPHSHDDPGKKFSLFSLKSSVLFQKRPFIKS